MEHDNKLFIFVGELRKSVRMLAVVLALATTLIFFLAPQLLATVQNHLADKLYFFHVSGPFLAHVKLALFSALFILMPWFLSVLWRCLAKPFGVSARQSIVFVVSTCLLFYSGTLFCYYITLPLGIKFLLGFGSEELRPVISVGRFVNFTTLFILAFGIVFELPVFMIFLAKVGVCTRAFYERNRKYALLLMAILAAVLTPTPDVVNMSLMGGPLYLLYESGIILLMVMRVK